SSDLWEMEYKLSTAQNWTSARKGGVQWDYDNDGDGSNNNSWRTSWQVENLTASATYNVRVKVHNPHGSSSCCLPAGSRFMKPRS
ncbi:MAG: hypothetical protein OXC11_04865, partial [Rhodospirillales bacterium]|nr:hypothetical protein [Rhodospirillales bacterium]